MARDSSGYIIALVMAAMWIVVILWALYGARAL